MKRLRILALLVTLFSLAILSPAQSGGTAPARSGGASKKAAPKMEAAATAAAIVDINHATPAELKTLPGIGEAYSAAIVRNRPYKNKTQLRSKNVVPPATYEKIKGLIIAKQ